VERVLLELEVGTVAAAERAAREVATAGRRVGAGATVGTGETVEEAPQQVGR